MPAPALALAPLRLVRWPGVITAAADAAAASLLFPCTVAKTVSVASAAALLYAGGVVLDDAVDADRDRTLHPDRPIPRGEVSRGAALVLGALLLGAGVGAAALAGEDALRAYAAVAGAVLLYDFALKHVGVLGVLGIGLCRGGSVLAAALSSPSFAQLLAERPGRALLVPLPWLLHGAGVTAASLLEESPRARTLLPFAAVGVLLPAVLAFPLLSYPGEAHEGLALVAAAVLTLALGRVLAGAPGREGKAVAGALVREGVFGFLLLDAAILALRGRAWEAGAAMALWAVLRFALSRERS